MCWWLRQCNHVHLQCRAADELPQVQADHHFHPPRPWHASRPSDRPTADAIQAEAVAALVPGSTKSDTTIFYGAGAGFDWNATGHGGIRVTADSVHVNLFDRFLKEPRNSVRVSIGPTRRWDKNVK